MDVIGTNTTNTTISTGANSHTSATEYCPHPRTHSLSLFLLVLKCVCVCVCVFVGSHSSTCLWRDQRHEKYGHVLKINDPRSYFPCVQYDPHTIHTERERSQ